MIPLPHVSKVYLCRKGVNMRKSFDGLATLAYNLFPIDPVSGALFAFFNERRTIVKLLFWDEDGYCVISKRLEKGTFSMQPTEESIVSLQDFYLILEGIDLKNIDRKKRYQLPQL